jgi:hypothetical protein
MKQLNFIGLTRKFWSIADGSFVAFHGFVYSPLILKQNAPKMDTNIIKIKRRQYYLPTKEKCFAGVNIM